MMCFFSKNLYNAALYNIRQHYFTEKKHLTYESNYHECKENENYKLLQAGVSQQTMKIVDRAFKTFFALIEKAKKGEYRFCDIKLPHYRPKDSLFNLVLSTNAISIKDGYLTVPMSMTFMQLYGREKIKIRVPDRILEHKIKEIRIIPICKGRKFKIQYVYEIEAENLNLNQDEKLAIDIGLENLATCISTVGTSFIMDGRRIKSINRLWNKRRAELQNRLPQGQYTSRLIQRLTLKRNNRTNDCIKKTARYIVNHCIEHNIGTIVCGYNIDFKRGINLGKKNNQNFTQISFGSLREQLGNLCERYGIKYIEQEEAYTSKASFLDLDEIPVFNADNPKKYEFSGKRITRGLYQSSDGRIVNADLNGAANILRKSSQNFDFEELGRGLLASPLRIKLV
ncbi:MAG: transposase [Selenomonadaceae bacterium]|nr:transposase [Selenomonadaceae bacterium]